MPADGVDGPGRREMLQGSAKVTVAAAASTMAVAAGMKAHPAYADTLYNSVFGAGGLIGPRAPVPNPPTATTGIRG
jgi:hypothetical protein